MPAADGDFERGVGVSEEVEVGLARLLGGIKKRDAADTHVDGLMILLTTNNQMLAPAEFSGNR